MTKKELKKIIKNKEIKIACISDRDYGYGITNEVKGLLSEVERNNLIRLYENFSEYFTILNENTFRNDDKIYRIG